MAVALAVVLLVIGALWIRQAEVIALVTQIAESVPPIPALAGLLFLVAANALARKLRGRPLLPPAQTLMVFSFLAISTAILGPGIARFLFSNLTAPIYYATPENHFGDLIPYIPRWFVPKDHAFIKGFYEGSRAGVPWGAWIPPLALWLAFFLLLWLTLLCLTLLVRRQWMENEKLSFPQLYLPLEITESRGAGFFRNPIMWIGFGIAAGYDLINITHALVPSIPSLGMQFDLGAGMNEKPWDALKGMTLYIRPEMVGLGYLVSLEVSFSAWFFSLLLRGEAVMGRALGWDVPGFPFAREQGIGAYIALAALLLWGARKTILAAIRRPPSRSLSPASSAVASGLRTPAPDAALSVPGMASQEPLRSAAKAPAGEMPSSTPSLEGGALPSSPTPSPAGGTLPSPPTPSPAGGEGATDTRSEVGEARWALGGAIIGFIGLVLWCRAAGLAVWVGALFFALILGVALVYCRIRAETGVPLIWGFPFGQHYDFILNLAGSHNLTAGGPASLVVLTNLVFLSRGYFPALAAYQMETIRLGEGVGMKRRRILPWIVLAVPAGFLIAFVVLLQTYYAKGAANIGLWGTWAAIPIFQQAVTTAHTYVPPKWDALTASGVGLLGAGALVGLRWLWFSCPLHPLGYAMATSYGDLFWGPFLMVWALKWLILRYGGHRLYTRLIPGFLGLALGHFFIAGVVWGAFGAYLPEALPGYQVWFG